MAFNEQSFRQRFHTLGDPAEEVFQKVKPFGASIRFGWRRPKGISLKSMPEGLRHMPDFYSNGGYLVEVVGLGRDGILKSIKLTKWEALKNWNQFCKRIEAELVVFAWNAHTHEYAIIPWPILVSLVGKARREGIKQFHDGPQYYPIRWEDIKNEVTVVRWVDNED